MQLLLVNTKHKWLQLVRSRKIIPLASRFWLLGRPKAANKMN